MPRNRIATAGASILFFLAVMLGSAAAQSATTGSVGKPLPLLQFTRHKTERKLPPHPKLAAVTTKKKAFRERIAKRVVTRQRRVIMEARSVPAPAPAPTPVASGAAAENLWPAANAATPGSGAMPTLTPDRPLPAVTTEPTVDTDPNQIVTGSHSVEAALPNGLNRAAPPADPVKATSPAQAVKAITVASAAPVPVVHAMVVKAEPQSPIGSASWLAHVLAALGGAITAGAVAWFLIRPAPERTYG